MSLDVFAAGVLYGFLLGLMLRGVQWAVLRLRGRPW